MLADNDGVVDHDAERDDERKKRDHVDGQPGGEHDRNGCGHGDRNAGGDPERRAGVQEQEQQGNDKGQADEPVVQKYVQAARDRFRQRSDQVDFNPRRQGCLHFGGDVLDLALHADRVAIGRTVNADRDRGIRADKIGTIPVHLPDPDSGHVSYGERRAVLRRAKDNGGDLAGGSLGHAGAHAGGARNVSGRISFRLFRYGVGDLTHGDIVTDEIERRDLDDRFRGRDTAYRAAGDPDRKQPGDELVGEVGQLVYANRSLDDYVGDPIRPATTHRLRIVGIGGEIGHGINGRADIFLRLSHVPARFELKRDRCLAFSRPGGCFRHAIHGL